MTDKEQIKWFVQLKGKVQGPFNNENLVQALKGMGDDNVNHALVWRRGLIEWINANQWPKADQKISQQIQKTAVSPPLANVIKSNPAVQQSTLKNNPVAESKKALEAIPHLQQDERNRTSIDAELFEKTFTQAFSEDVFYRVQINYMDQPLMSRDQLLQLVAKTEDVSEISIQDNKTKEWKDLYAYPDLVEKMGISRRKTQRVPILAQFSGSSNKNKNVSYRVITISEGGMGFTENYDLKIGDEVDGRISSPHFFQPINVKADVIYAGLDGYIGLKFSAITDETKSAIIEYVKKFGKSAPRT